MIEADQKLKELLGLITQGVWKAHHRDSGNKDNDPSWITGLDYPLGWEVEPTESPARGQFVSGYDAVFTALAQNRMGPLLVELDALEEERLRLKNVLKRYGSHDGNCDRKLHCSCGLFAALGN